MLCLVGLQKAGVTISECGIIVDSLVSLSSLYESHSGGTNPYG